MKQDTTIIHNQNIEKADHFKALETRYREEAAKLTENNQLVGARRLVQEADECQRLYFIYKRRIDHRYRWWERALQAIGVAI